AALTVAQLEDKLAAETVRELTVRYQAGFVNLADVERARLQQGDTAVQLDEARLAEQQAELGLWKTTGQLGTLAQ
ncbi:MAG TPA: hypothetical protein VND92_10440, partial [Vicinamibacterales bacterium]|nr:hypothetical protein [Vicinamibacterales bacterium]